MTENGRVELLFFLGRKHSMQILLASAKIMMHLATEEFQHLFDWQRVRQEVRIVQPLFYVRKRNELKIQAVWAKTCRGAMTRYILEKRIEHPTDLHAFSYEGFNYEPTLGEADYPIFVKNV